MLRSHFEFAYVLHIIFISSISTASFNELCSNDLSCHNPLICSNSSKCICSTSSSSFWNNKQNTCLFCSQGWIEWKNEKCLLFITPLHGGIIYEKAKNACIQHSAQLLQIDNYQDFLQLKYKTNQLLEGEHTNTVVEFLNNSVWINFTDSIAWIDSYEWCQTDDEYNISSWNSCIRITYQYSKDKNNISICLSHAQCNEKFSYICESSALIEDNENDTKYHERIFDSIFGIVENIFYPGPKQTEPPPQPPQIIFQTNAPRPQPELILPQTSKSNNTILYIGIAVAIIFLIGIILCCCFGGGLLFFHNTNTSKTPIQSSRSRRRQNRTSVDSTASDATY